MIQSKQISSNEERSAALHFLQNQHLLHLATLNKVNHPDVASVLYFCTTDFRIYFSARSGSRKFENLSHCEHVGFSVTSEADLLTVQGQGIAHITTDPEIIGQMIAHLAGIVGEPLAERWPPPVFKVQDGSYHVVEIIPQWLRLGDFRDVKPGEEGYFSQII